MNAFRQYLQQAGLTTEPAYLAGSGCVIGEKFLLGAYEVVFRVEGRVLRICHFGRAADQCCQPAALFRLRALLRQMVQPDPQKQHSTIDPLQINALSALVITDGPDRARRQQHQKLARLLQRLGATQQPYHGEMWWVLPLSALCSSPT